MSPKKTIIDFTVEACLHRVRQEEALLLLIAIMGLLFVCYNRRCSLRNTCVLMPEEGGSYDANVPLRVV